VQSEWASPYPEIKTADPIDTSIPTFTWRQTRENNET